MAVTTMDTYTQVGIVEDVSDIVSMISPTETPALSLMGSEKVDNTLYNWLEDALDAPAVNAQLEGAAPPTANMSPVVERSNRTQIFAKTVVVTGTARAVKLHGASDEFARQMAKKAKEIKRDLEYALVFTGQAQVAGNNSTARKFDGVQAQHLSGNTLGNSGTPRALTETIFLSASQTAYNNGSDVSVCLIKPSDSQIVAGFAASTGRLRDLDGEAKKIVNVIDIYEGPFGTHRFVMARWLRTKDAILMDPDMWKLRPLRNWFTKELPENGDFSSKEMIGEFGVSHRNFNDGVLITDLS